MREIIFEDVELSKILDIIHKLNEEIYEQCGDFGVMYRPFEFCCNGGYGLDSACITFFDQEIWSTEDSEREFDEDANEWEPLEDYLRKQVNTMLDTLRKIKL